MSTLNLKTNACLEKAWEILKKNVALMGLYAFSLSSLHTSILTWNALCENGEEYGKKMIALFQQYFIVIIWIVNQNLKGCVP
jgi:hypothetical protein